MVVGAVRTVGLATSKFRPLTGICGGLTWPSQLSPTHSAGGSNGTSERARPMVVTLNDSQSHFGACESVFGVVKFPVTLLGAPTLFGAPHSAHIVGQEATTTSTTGCVTAS